MKTLLWASVALAAFSCAAQAATITQSSTLPFPTAVGYTAPQLVATKGDVNNNLTLSVPNQYLSPFAGTTADGGLYSSVQGNGSAYFNGSGNTFSLIWGSPDTYNRLSFYSGANGTGDVLATIFGSSIIPSNGTSFANVTIGDIGNFNSVVLFNDPTSNAFEVSTFNVSSVPLPASLPMFGGAILALGIFGYRMRSKAVQAKA